MSETVVKVDHAAVRFNLALQQKMGIKDYVNKIVHRQLLFQEFFALKDVSLDVKKGESWGIIGKNGSGKSTLLKLITGILTPYRGTVYTKGNIAPLLELGAGFDPELTGRENIVMNGLILGLTKAEVMSHFDEIVDFSELKDFLDVPIKNYSSGMKSRLGFAVATCIKPDILIADEILSAGDKTFQEKCQARMKELLSGGTTLLFVSHSSQAVRSMCEKVLWLDEGNVKMAGAAADVMDKYDHR